MKISACMIMKNEEAVLDRCLKSIRPFVDEITIVDTGSTDKSVDIAESYGARVFHHPWENNFSKHRNQSIGYARGDWLLFIDCDEEMVVDPRLTNRKRFKKKLRQLGTNFDAVSIRMNDLNSKGQNKCAWDMPKIFKAGNIRYDGIVHNQAIFGGQTCFVPDIYFNHYGYDLEEKKMKAKAERSLPLLYERIEKDSTDHEGLYYLSNYLLTLDKIDESIRYGKQALALIDRENMGIFHSLYHSIGSAYFRKGDASNCLSYFQAGLEIDPDDIDLHFDMCMVARAAGNREALKFHAWRYFECIKNIGPSPKFRLNAGDDKKELVANWVNTKRILITGHSRSGTGYTNKILQAAGLDIGHEVVGLDGVVSWLHIANGQVPWLAAPVRNNTFDLIFHQVRDPLKVISSSMTESAAAFGFRFKKIGKPDGERGLKWAMWSWLKWNELIESKADFRYRVEDIEKALPEALKTAGYKIDNLDFSKAQKNENTRSHEIYTWQDLKAADSELCKQIQEKAVIYGYSIE